MTPEERAKVTREKMLSATRPGGYIDNAEIERVIADAIREAVAEEREACAQEAERPQDGCHWYVLPVAATNIRARDSR